MLREFWSRFYDRWLRPLPSEDGSGPGTWTRR